MTGEQLRLLAKMKSLIKNKQRRFQTRPDRDYLENLLDFGFCEEEAWNCILGLKPQFYFPDPKPDFYKTDLSLIFKRKIAEEMAYIKLKIENNNGNEEVVCLSFHIDGKGAIL